MPSVTCSGVELTDFGHSKFSNLSGGWRSGIATSTATGGKLKLRGTCDTVEKLIPGTHSAQRQLPQFASPIVTPLRGPLDFFVIFRRQTYRCNVSVGDPQVTSFSEWLLLKDCTDYRLYIQHRFDFMGVHGAKECLKVRLLFRSLYLRNLWKTGCFRGSLWDGQVSDEVLEVLLQGGDI